MGLTARDQRAVKAVLSAIPAISDRVEPCPPRVAEALRQAPELEVELACGLGELDQVRVLPCEGSRLRAWLGGYRARPFEAREKRILAAVVPALLERLELEERVAEAPLLRAGLDALLSVLEMPALLVSPRGVVWHANRAAAALLDADPRLADDLVERVRSGAVAGRLTAVGGEGGVPLHHLVLLEAPKDTLALRVALAKERWGLTARQCEVLALAARGYTNRNIAERLGCREGTVELHVTNLLRRSQLGSRTELVGQLFLLR